MQNTPKGLRLHIGIFGRRNSGKSSLINALTYQDVSIVSEIPGTTTDPVERAMEFLPIGPVVFIDTAGLDDVGALGKKRIKKSLQVIDRVDIALLVNDSTLWNAFEESLLAEFQDKQIPVIVVFNKSDTDLPDEEVEKKLASAMIKSVRTSVFKNEGISELRDILVSSVPEKFIKSPQIIGDLVKPGDIVVLVLPIDKEAPKGRIILPQVQTLRELLDTGVISIVSRETELDVALKTLNKPPALVVTDSQAFSEVSKMVPEEVLLTSFSILYSRAKGDLRAFMEGAKSIKNLQPGDKILISESCAHHPIGEDIGRIKIPRWLEAYVGGKLNFTTIQGHDFPEDIQDYKLAIQCGSCVSNRREILTRIARCKAAKVHITNYGLAVAFIKGIFDRATKVFHGAS